MDLDAGAEEALTDAGATVLPLRRVVSVLVGVVALWSSLVLAGWLAGASWAAPPDGGVSMKVNTALAFLILAVGLAGTGVRRRAVAGTAVALIGLSALVEYVGGWTFGIDELLVQDPAAGPAPGRMAPVTALAFVLLGAALLTAAHPARAIQRGRIVAMCAVLMIAATGIISFGLASAPLLRFGPWVTMAVSTAVLFVLATGAMLLRSPPPTVLLALRRGVTGVMLRRTLVAVVVLPYAAARLALIGEGAHWYDTRFTIALVTTTTTGLLAAAVWRTAAVASRADELRLTVQREADRLAQEQVLAAAIQASDERFRSSIDVLPESVSVFRAIRDEAGAIVDFAWTYANVASAQVTHRERSDLEGHTLLAVLPQHGPSGMFDTYVGVVETGEPFVDPTLWLAESWGDGVERRRAFDVRANKLEDGLVVVSREVTTERETEAELVRRTAELERANFEIMQLAELGNLLQACVSTDEAMIVAGQSGEMLFPSWSGVLSLVGDAELVEPTATWGGATEGWPRFSQAACWALRLKRPHVSESTGPRCDHLANTSNAACLCVPMLGQGEPVGILHLAPRSAGPSDSAPVDFDEPTQRLAVTVGERLAVAIANLRLRDMLREQSVRDSLTGLFNRRYLDEAMGRELSRAQREQSALSVIQIDVDDFKAFNDHYGHDAGDAVLESVAKAFLDFFRGSDIVCRYGGEEFTVVVPQSTMDVTEQRAQALRARLRDLIVDFNRATLPTPTISCGIATYPESGSDAAGLLRAADKALYAAKQSGRDRVRTATDPRPH